MENKITDIKKIALETIEQEAISIKGLLEFITDDFEKIVTLLYENKGRVIVSGIGKSAIIAQKIVATFNSTGTPSLFLHAAEAIHGDLGMVRPGDILIIISKSGNSPEIKALIPLIKNFGNPVIGMTGNMESYLSKSSDWVLNTTVSREACPNNLAPTSSTTAQLVMGDALAVCLMELNGFSGDDFARFHPGGSLGKQLYTTVADLIADNPVPKVLPTTPIPETVIEMTGKRLGATAVVNDDDTIYGIITDGDLRRMLHNKTAISGTLAKDICSKKPKTINENQLAVKALDIMRQHDITHMMVIDKNNIYKGILHIHDLIKEGII